MLDTEGGGRDHGQEDRGGEGEAGRRGEDEGQVGADHGHVAVGEVDEPQDPVDQRVADGQQRVAAAGHDPGQEELGEELYGRSGALAGAPWSRA
jgi:hypothetical protein